MFDMGLFPSSGTLKSPWVLHRFSPLTNGSSRGHNHQSAIDLTRPEDLPRGHAMTPMEVYKLESAKWTLEAVDVAVVEMCTRAWFCEPLLKAQTDWSFFVVKHCLEGTFYIMLGYLGFYFPFWAFKLAMSLWDVFAKSVGFGHSESSLLHPRDFSTEAFPMTRSARRWSTAWTRRRWPPWAPLCRPKAPRLCSPGQVGPHKVARCPKFLQISLRTSVDRTDRSMSYCYKKLISLGLLWW